MDRGREFTDEDLMTTEGKKSAKVPGNISEEVTLIVFRTCCLARGGKQFASQVNLNGDGFLLYSLDKNSEPVSILNGEKWK